MKKLKLDMDGVLVNFVGGAIALHKLPMKFHEWTSWNAHHTHNIKDEKFYEEMNFEFWSMLGWTPEGERLLKFLERIVPRKQISLLTAPILTAGCADGKRAWVKRNIPEYFDRLFIGTDKSALAHPTACLVDDSDKNVSGFHAAGGHAVLVPRPWNILKGLTDAEGSYKIKHVTEQVKGWYNG